MDHRRRFTGKDESKSILDDMDLVNEEHDDNNNASLAHRLCQRLAEHFSLKYIQYGDLDDVFFDYEQLKNDAAQSISTSCGVIIDHFPSSIEDLDRFQTEVGSRIEFVPRHVHMCDLVQIGPCSVLIYMGDRQTEKSHDPLNRIIEEFKRRGRAFHVNERIRVNRCTLHHSVPGRCSFKIGRHL